MALIDKSDSSKMKEALLLSIYLGHDQISENILRHPKYKILSEKKFQSVDTDSFWQTPSSDDAQFPADVTPLMLGKSLIFLKFFIYLFSLFISLFFYISFSI